MKGKKTWISALLFALLGAFNIYNGDTAGGTQQIAAAVGLIGLGSKLDAAAGGLVQ